MAAIANQTIELDLTPGGVSPFLYVSQGDYGSRNLIFNLLLNGQPYTIPASIKTVKLSGMTNKGNVFGVTCTFSGSTAIASLTADMTVDAGLDICELRFVDKYENSLGTANFFIVVEDSPIATKIMYTNVYWSELSKSWAVGGTGLRSGEDTDNSKYYASIVNDVRPQLDENTNSISVLEALINQYVIPSEQQPDEVVAARVGFDGITYENLGEAIRSQVTKYGYIPGSEEIYFRHG